MYTFGLILLYISIYTMSIVNSKNIHFFLNIPNKSIKQTVHRIPCTVSRLYRFSDVSVIFSFIVVGVILLIE